jgi:hypothetical protein
MGVFDRLGCGTATTRPPEGTIRQNRLTEADLAFLILAKPRTQVRRILEAVANDEAPSAAKPQESAPPVRSGLPPVYVTQGTVLVEFNLKGEDPGFFVVINPIPEYTLTHRGERYTVFMPLLEPAGSDPVPTRPEPAFVRSNSSPHRIKVPSEDQKPAFFEEILKGAALQQSRVELRLRKAENDHEFELVGLTVPAPPDPGTASHK